MKSKIYSVKFCKILFSLIKNCKTLSNAGKDQTILLNWAKLSAKILLNMSWLVKRGFLTINESFTTFSFMENG